MDIKQIEQQLRGLEKDRELDRIVGEIERAENEMKGVEAKLKMLAEKRRDRELAIVEEKHKLERELEEAKSKANASK